MDLNGCAGADATGMASALAALGFPAFKRGQREVVEAVLAGRDALALLPTGGGKSLCYQLPSLLLPGVTLVVSPLLALIRDQVARAQARGLAAVGFSSALGPEGRATQLHAVARRQVKLVYAAPEGLRSPALLDALAAAGVSLVAVDEAHCISAWGHDFRPDYARLGALRTRLQPRSLLAVTATATARVREDILRSLGMPDALVVVSGLDRDNLALEVQEARGGASKLAALTAATADLQGGSAILYCATRRASEVLAAQLRAEGRGAGAYHAGMSAPAREATQGAWERGELPILCATTAFGMGVDKPDVRLVAHHGLPRSPEAYNQEVGRAGRDGLPARGLLLHDPADVRVAWRLLRGRGPDGATVRSVYAAAWQEQERTGWAAPSLDALVDRASAGHGAAVRAAGVYLVQAGALREEPGGLRAVGGAPEGLPVEDALLRERQAAAHQKLADMLGYVHRAACRQAFLVQYFTGHTAPACGHCDLCRGARPALVTAEQHTDVLKALSCVARMLGRFGRVRVVDVLMGSRSRPVLLARLDRLSTHGLLRERGRDRVEVLVEALERAGLVQGSSGPYPTLDLTAAGEAVLAGGPVPPLRLDPAPAAPSPGPAGAPEEVAPGRGAPAAEALEQALRAWRRQVAGELRVPPYVLLPERTLRAVSQLRPRTGLELRQVPGMGDARVRRYGEAILELVRAG